MIDWLALAIGAGIGALIGAVAMLWMIGRIRFR